MNVGAYSKCVLAKVKKKFARAWQGYIFAKEAFCEWWRGGVVNKSMTGEDPLHRGR